MRQGRIIYDKNKQIEILTKCIEEYILNEKKKNGILILQENG